MKKIHLHLLICALLLSFTTLETQASNFAFNIDIQNTTGQTANNLEMVFSSSSNINVTYTYDNFLPNSYPGFPNEQTTNLGNIVSLYWYGANFTNDSSAHVGAEGYTSGNSSITFNEAYWTNNGTNIGNISLGNIQFTEGPAWNVVWDKFTDPTTGAIINEMVEFQGNYVNQDVIGANDIQAQFGVVNIGANPIDLNYLNPQNQEVNQAIVFNNIDIAAVPVPTAFSMMLIGFGMMSTLVKSANRKPAQPDNLPA